MYSDTQITLASESKLLLTLADNWKNRAAVRKERLDLRPYYDTSLPDFPIDMVPFWNFSEFEEIPESDKLKVLAAAWISYNEKTIYIEDRVINPLCTLLLKNGLPGVDDVHTKQVLAQTLVDEQFHILMCLEVCSCARKQHHLQDFVVNEPLLGKSLSDALQKTKDDNEYNLVTMAYGTVAEMTINAFLKQLSEDKTIQPINRLNTELHRRDEASHAAIFGEITRSVYSELTENDREKFKQYITRALSDFVELDLSFWSTILDYLNIKNKKLILEKLEGMSTQKRASRDYSAFIRMLEDISIKEETNFIFD